MISKRLPILSCFFLFLGLSFLLPNVFVVRDFFDVVDDVHHAKNNSRTTLSWARRVDRSSARCFVYFLNRNLARGVIHTHRSFFYYFPAECRFTDATRPFCVYRQQAPSLQQKTKHPGNILP
jgi:hypothetical protein